MSIDISFNIQLAIAIVTSAFVGGISGYIGSLMLTKRMSLMGGALGHMTLPGIALGLAYGFDVSLGALLFLIVGIAAIWYIEIKTELPTESIVAIVFATSVAVALLFLKHEEIDIALIGDISKITFTIAVVTSVIAVAIFFVVRTILPKMIIMSISEDLAFTEKINVQLYKFIYLACIAGVVALGVRIVGGLMTAALVAIPACASKNMSGSLSRYTLVSLLIGAMSCAIGVLAAHVTILPVGPMIIICSAILFLISLFFNP